MRFSNLLWSVLLIASLAPLAAAQSPLSDRTSDSYTISPCLVTLIQDVQVPAKEPGVLESIEVREGFRVKAGQLLAQLSDGKAQRQKALAELELKVTQMQSDNDVDKRFAEKSAEVTEMDYREAEYARERVANSVSRFELRRRGFSWERARLQTEQAERDHKVATVQANIAKAKVAMAENEISRRRVEAPFAGVVAETYKYAGEWVNPGDSILRLLRMDRLQVEGFVDAQDFAPNEIFGKPVTIVVKLARDHTESFQSKIGFVSPDVEASGEFHVWAEIDNRTTRQGDYLVRPGLTATMTLNINYAAIASPRRR